MKTKWMMLAPLVVALGACKMPPWGGSQTQGTQTAQTSPTPAPGAVIEPVATPTPALAAGAPAVPAQPIGSAPAAGAPLAGGEQAASAGPATVPPVVAPQAEPARVAPPRPRPKKVPQGTELVVTLETALSSGRSKSGDAILAKLEEDVVVAEKVLVRSGAEVRGRVVSAVPAGRTKGRGKLAFVFDDLVVGGKSHTIETGTVELTARSAHGRDAAMVGGGAGAGAIVGAVVGGKKGAAIGAVVGAGAGTGAVLATKGYEAELPAGQTLTVKLAQDLVL
jgi:hypothetical protein